MRNYEPIRIPFDLNFDQKSKKELKPYFTWFTSIFGERVDALTNLVKSTPGFEDWNPDFRPESLNTLGRWLADNVETRERTREEKMQIYEKAPSWFKAVSIGSKELTNTTVLLAVDVAIYLSQVFLKNNEALFWDQHLARKNDVDYGHAVLRGFGNLHLNPIRMAIALAYGIAHGWRTADGLREIYDIWVNNIPAGDKSS